MGEYLYKGEAALQAGDRQQALAFFGRALRDEPRNPEVWLGLAAAVDDDAKKKDCLKQVLRLDPGNERAMDALALLEARPAEMLPDWFTEDSAGGQPHEQTVERLEDPGVEQAIPGEVIAEELLPEELVAEEVFPEEIIPEEGILEEAACQELPGSDRGTEVQTEPEQSEAEATEPEEQFDLVEEIPMGRRAGRTDQPMPPADRETQANASTNRAPTGPLRWSGLPVWGKLGVGVFGLILASSLLLFGYAWAARSGTDFVYAASSILNDFAYTGIFLAAALFSYLALREPAAREWFKERSPLLEVVIFLALTQLLAGLGSSVMENFTNLPYAGFRGWGATLTFASQCVNGLLMIAGVLLGIEHLRRNRR